MNLVVIPPHGDVTLAANLAPGWEQIDVGRQFAARVTDAEELVRMVDEPRDQPLDAELQLLGRAAVDVMSRVPPPDARLAALGAALRTISGPPSAVRMQLDDLELAAGTTESGGDVVRASFGVAPYEREMTEAKEHACDASRVCLVVERDQQLPAALALARDLRPRSVEVSGSFAKHHWNAVGRLDGFDCANLASLPVLQWRVELPWERGTDGIAWREHTTDPIPESPWAGRVRLFEVLNVERLTSSDCRVAVLGFAGGSQTTVLDEDGSSVDVSDLAVAANKLRARGVRLVGDCWIGAPAQGRESVGAMFEHLETSRLVDVVAGFRVFGWAVHRPSGIWGKVHVEAYEPHREHDLARTRRFQCPGTLSKTEAEDVMRALQPRVAALRGPLPGRLAAAYVGVFDDLDKLEGVALDPACAVIPAPRGPDEGVPSATAAWYAANLRTGVVVKLDSRVARALVALGQGGDDSVLPPGIQDRLFPILVAKGILRGAGS